MRVMASWDSYTREGDDGPNLGQTRGPPPLQVHQTIDRLTPVLLGAC
jgi:hypothetical protein